MNSPELPRLIQYFFTDWLVRQFGASQQTVAAYRDTFRLLLRFAGAELEREPSKLLVEELDSAFLEKFLEYLERGRGNSVRTRNSRLSALHAFFRYVAITEPSLALHCQRILAIPRKRHERRPMEFLSEEEAKAIVAAPSPLTWIGQRDRTILLLGIQTGLRNTELRTLRWLDVELGAGAFVRCYGKGRKMRCTPLSKEVDVRQL
ncbi:MAG: tyrosine-type recombinase/integrase [Vulcanimicrobiota bacterium]